MYSYIVHVGHIKLRFFFLNPIVCDYVGHCVTASSSPALVDTSPPHTGSISVERLEKRMGLSLSSESEVGGVSGEM